MDTEHQPIRPGQIEIRLEGFERPIILKPSLHAATTLSRRYGGLQGLAEKIQQLDPEAIVAVIGVGGGLTEAGLQRLPEAAFTAGYLQLGVPLTRFVVALANGGRPGTGGAPAEGSDPSP